MILGVSSCDRGDMVRRVAGSSLVSSTGEQTPSMARQYGGLTRKYASDGGDELAACLPPDLRHLLSATAAATPSSHHRQTTTQRLQQHGLLRSTAITSAVNSLVNSDGTIRAVADLMDDRPSVLNISALLILYDFTLIFLIPFLLLK